MLGRPLQGDPSSPYLWLSEKGTLLRGSMSPQGPKGPLIILTFNEPGFCCKLHCLGAAQLDESRTRHNRATLHESLQVSPHRPPLLLLGVLLNSHSSRDSDSIGVLEISETVLPPQSRAYLLPEIVLAPPAHGCRMGSWEPSAWSLLLAYFAGSLVSLHEKDVITVSLQKKSCTSSSKTLDCKP